MQNKCIYFLGKPGSGSPLYQKPGNLLGWYYYYSINFNNFIAVLTIKYLTTGSFGTPGTPGTPGSPGLPGN